MKRIVVKIGTGVLTGENGKLDEAAIAEITGQIAKLIGSGKDVLIVSSGAIRYGMSLLNLKRRPSNLAELQSLAAIGQTGLMDTYNKCFAKWGNLTGQILLTQDDFDDRVRYLNIKYTINTLLKHRVVPIINENDTISTEEIKCGDNDRISALVADLSAADILLILTNVDGLLDRNGSVIKNVDRVTDEIRELVDKRCAASGTGGMFTKIQAAEFAVKSGIECYIGNGKKPGMILDLLQGRGTFTRFRAEGTKISAKKRWIGFGSKVKGAIVVDEGAKTAIIERKKSLLSAGIVGGKGTFKTGDIVSIKDKNANEIARGITNYSSVEVNIIKGIKTKDIESVLGYKDHDEVVHRDNLLIF